MPAMEKIGKIDETRTLKCSQRSGSLYLYLPKAFVEFYDLMGGDTIKVKLQDVFRPAKDEEEPNANS